MRHSSTIAKLYLKNMGFYEKISLSYEVGSTLTGRVAVAERLLQVRATPQPTLTTTAAVPVLQGTIFCNNIRHGPKSGCRVQCLLAKGGLVCGYRDAVSEVSWSFLRHEDGKDIFRFEWRFPGDKATATTQTYEIAYDGSLTMVFEDDVQRLVLDFSMTTEPRSK